MFTIAITDDALDEEDETIILVLSNADNAAMGGNDSATFTIRDNDLPDDQFHIHLPLVVRVFP
jgi:hypothetical protein